MNLRRVSFHARMTFATSVEMGRVLFCCLGVLRSEAFASRNVSLYMAISCMRCIHSENARVVSFGEVYKCSDAVKEEDPVVPAMRRIEAVFGLFAMALPCNSNDAGLSTPRLDKKGMQLDHCDCRRVSEPSHYLQQMSRTRWCPRRGASPVTCVSRSG